MVVVVVVALGVDCRHGQSGVVDATLEADVDAVGDVNAAVEKDAVDEADKVGTPVGAEVDAAVKLSAANDDVTTEEEVDELMVCRAERFAIRWEQEQLEGWSTTVDEFVVTAVAGVVAAVPVQPPLLVVEPLVAMLGPAMSVVVTAPLAVVVPLAMVEVLAAADPLA